MEINCGKIKLMTKNSAGFRKEMVLNNETVDVLTNSNISVQSYLIKDPNQK